MIAIWWAKIQGWAVTIGAIILAILTVGIYERSKGKSAQKAVQATQDAKANAQAVQQTIKVQESRNATDQVVQSLPDAPAQKVADAAPGTAAGELRDHWTRD